MDQWDPLPKTNRKKIASEKQGNEIMDSNHLEFSGAKLFLGGVQGNYSIP